MKLRTYQPDDCKEMVALFYDTVHTVNAKDYPKEQLDVWATGSIDCATWNASFLAHHTVVVEENDEIIGFGDMDADGYLDRLYVHSEYQRQGVATQIVNELEKHARTNGVSTFTTYASITAVPFFENCRYQILHENIVVRNGIELINYKMSKSE